MDAFLSFSTIVLLGTNESYQSDTSINIECCCNYIAWNRCPQGNLYWLGVRKYATAMDALYTIETSTKDINWCEMPIAGIVNHPTVAQLCKPHGHCALDYLSKAYCVCYAGWTGTFCKQRNMVLWLRSLGLSVVILDNDTVTSLLEYLTTFAKK